MPIITGVGPALTKLYEVFDGMPCRADRQADGDSDAEDAGYPEAVRRTTEYADAVSISDELESLALELRDADGDVVATESIYITDTEYLLARAREPLDESELALPPEVEEEIAREVEEMLAHWRENRPPWLEDDDDYDDDAWKPRSPPSRYQIFVTLEGDFRF
jgi:hypothetical protein